MVGAYTALPPAVAATVPRRTIFRDSWIRHHSTSASVEATTSSPATPSPVSTPPMTPRNLKLGELRQKWDVAAKPAPVVLTTYTPPGGEAKTELQGVTGKVSKAKAFFESAPLTSPEKPSSPKDAPEDNDNDDNTVVSYRVKHPDYRVSPKPKPRRLRNTISTFPTWVSEGEPKPPEREDGADDVQVVITNVSGNVWKEKAEEEDIPVEINRIKPAFVRRRFGTVTGLVGDRSNIEEAVRTRLASERESYPSRTTPRAIAAVAAAEIAARSHFPVELGVDVASLDFSSDEESDYNSGTEIDVDEKDGDEIDGGDDEAILQTRRVVVVSSAAAAGGTGVLTAPSGKINNNHSSSESPSGNQEAKEEEEDISELQERVSRTRDGAWNRRNLTAPVIGPRFTSCIRLEPTRIVPATVVVRSDDIPISECQGANSASEEGHASSPETMIVLPEDGQVQLQQAANAAAPRVVAACIKSYHDIPEELFNSLQESSVDPNPSPSPPPLPTSSPPPPIHHGTIIHEEEEVVTSPPAPAPRSDWKTMREGRKALFMGEVSDADTEGSEVDLGGVASTSDYHTSDGRGSSLSGASDDHHHQHNHHHHLHPHVNILKQDQHQRNDINQYYHNGQEDYHQNAKDADEEAEFDCYNHQEPTAPPTVLIRNNFRGFCSTMLGSPPMPSSVEYLPPRPPPPVDDHRPGSSSSLLEEELRAAGVYFRRPGSPPRVPSRGRTLSPPPRPPSSLKLERHSLGEAEAVAAALHVLDASLAGLSDSSGESSPTRSHASTVVERRQHQSSLNSSSDDTSPLSLSQSSSDRLCSSGRSDPSVDVSDYQKGGEGPSSSPPLAVVRSLYSSDLNDSDTSSAVDYTFESEDSASRYPGLEGEVSDDAHGASRLNVGGGIVRGGLTRASTTVGGTVEDGGPYPGPHHHPPVPPKDPNAMENFNLIEEVYVDTRPVPRTTVSMRAYYPGVHYDSSSSSSPKGTLRPPSSASTSSRHPERGTSLDSTQTVPADSDSGHESGATSPCGTLILDDTQSPPPSPPNNHTLKTQSTSMHTHTPSISHSRTSSLQSCRGPGVLEGEVGVAVVGDPTHTDMGVGGMALDPRPPTHFVVVAIDFGTTYSGYAFSFTRDPDSIHMMKKWEGGDPGVQNQKTPTIVLLTPEEEFHSMGFIARDTYHDLDPKDAKKWLYFDKFKMALHADQTLSRDTLLEAANGRRIPALKIFSYALKYFRDHALKELSDQAGVEVLEEDVRWVITVPAIWSHPAKQFMRTAAYQAQMGSSSRPEQLLIALEPEAAAIYCRRLRRHQLLPERPPELRTPRHSILKETTPPSDASSVPALPELDRDTVYAVVDCGGGTVDITVHQMTDKSTGHLKELHKATGGPYGSTGVDAEFERLLETIFGADFWQTFRQQRPAAYVDLMIAFESRKRNASPYRSNPLNIALPFSFIDLYRKFKGKDVEWAMKKHQNLGVKWSAQGMLRVEQETMRQLFLPTLSNITQAIEAVLSAPEVGRLQYMFLVGGFAESELLQKHIRETFGHRVNVIIPQGMGLAILRGAVQFGLDPGVVTVRRSRLTYGVGVLNRYLRGHHPPDKRVVAAGSEWCADVLDKFVIVDESIAIGDVVVRPYTPATPGQSTVILHLYATQRHDAKFVTEDGVQRVGTLHLELGAPVQDNANSPSPGGRREITVHMKFGDTEVKASAIDHLTGQIVRANIDFLTL